MQERSRSSFWPALAWLGLAFACAISLEAAALLHWIPWQKISANSAMMTAFVAEHRVSATLVFLCIYVGAALLLCPAQLWIIVAGSFLFGPVEGALTSWAGAILGAIAVFAAAKGAFGDSYVRRTRGLPARVASEFNKDSLLYMLALRWLPVSPYWIANVVPPLLGASFGPFLLTTVVGVLPDVVTYSLVGTGLGTILNAGRLPDLGTLPHRFLPILVAIGVLPLVAIFVRRVVGVRKRAEGEP